MMTRSHGLACICVLLLCACVSYGPSAARANAQEKQAPANKLVLVAVDKNKRLVTTLRKEDIRVLEDGIEREVITLERETDLPLSLAILVDKSASQERMLPNIKLLARAFVDSIMRPRVDSIAVISFAHKAELEGDVTDDQEQAHRAIEQIKFEPPVGYLGRGQVAGTPPISGTNQTKVGSTALWDAVWVASEKLLKLSPADTRRAILLITDGTDSSSQTRMSDAIKGALNSGVVIYAIGMGDNDFAGIDGGALRKAAEKTGGRAFVPGKKSELPAIFSEIQDGIRSRYLLSYSPGGPNSGGSSHKVRIEIVNPELLKQKVKLFYRNDSASPKN
ncbi:MAG TPA: VWA domain-containing protein [Pyrinomonadaceae bacterium]|nr:VWA domain-containing protein [Pyrinomonadaceae bacterium]